MYQSNKKYFFLTFVALCFSFIVQSAEANFKIVVSANHSDWVYKLNEKAKFNVVVTKDGKVINNVKIHYEIGPEKMPAQIRDSALLERGKLEIEAGTMAVPGFLRCKIKAEYDKNKYEEVVTFAFAPEKIQPTTTMPDDFKSFWGNAIADNSKLPLDAQMNLLPKRCTEKVNVYEVNFQNGKAGRRVYGILCVPKTAGKYPAVLQVPGAGVRPYYGSMEMAEKGVITLQIGIHGIPVTLDSIVYDNLGHGALTGYHLFNLDNKDTYYYKHVYLGCIKAVDFIYTLPEFDGNSLAVSGGSQGGALSIVTAALDKRVKALSCFYPALSDMTGYLEGRAGGWPHMFQRINAGTKEKVATSKYYDVVNFAKLITVPGFYSFGFNDNVCPPTSMYVAYNSIVAPKSLFIAKETGHYRTEEQIAKSNEFIFRQLNANQ